MAFDQLQCQFPNAMVTFIVPLWKWNYDKWQTAPVKCFIVTQCAHFDMSMEGWNNISCIVQYQENDISNIGKFPDKNIKNEYFQMFILYIKLQKTIINQNI